MGFGIVTDNKATLGRIISPIDKLSAEMLDLKVEIANLKKEVDEILELLKFIEEGLKK